MGLYSELKRRNVIRVAAFYLAAAWLLAQVIDLVAPVFGIPESVLRIVIIAAVIGFVPAVVLAWVFELTPQGIRRDDEVDHDHPSVRQRQKRFDRAVLIALLLAVTYFSVDKFLLDPMRDKALEDAAELRGRVQERLDSVGIVSIAVMPLRFEGDNSDYEILASGIPENTINLLAAFDGVDIRAWSAVRSYKDQDIDVVQVAGRLGVTHLVEGTIRVIGDNVQITAQLIDTTTNTVLWPYDSNPRQLSIDSIFNVQNEISASIADALQVQLTPNNLGDPEDSGTDNWGAYLAYMTGREALADRTISQIDAAVEDFLEAIELDPEYAEPYSGLHDACWLYQSYANAFHPECKRPIRQYLDIALGLDESLGDAWISLARHLAPGFPFCDWPDEKKIQGMNAMRKGLLLSPASVHAYHWYALFLNDECTATDSDQYAANRIEFERVLLKGLSIAPLYVTFHQLLAYHYSREGDANAAFDVARGMIGRFPTSYKGYQALATLEYSMNGRLDRYIKHSLEAYTRHPEGWLTLLRIADAYISLGDPETARQYLGLAAYLRPAEDFSSWQLIFSTAMATLFEDGSDAAEAYLLEMVDSDDVWPVMLHWLLLNLELADDRVEAAKARMEAIHSICDLQAIPCWPVRHMGTARMMQVQRNNEEAQALVQETWGPFRQAIDRFGRRRIGMQGIGINEARILSMLGKQDLALHELKAAVEDGWRGYCSFDFSIGERFYCTPYWRFDAEYDFLLDGIRAEPEFKQAFEIIEQDMARQLESVNEMAGNGQLKIPEAIAALDAQAEIQSDQTQ